MLGGKAVAGLRDRNTPQVAFRGWCATSRRYQTPSARNTAWGWAGGTGVGLEQGVAAAVAQHRADQRVSHRHIDRVPTGGRIEAVYRACVNAE